ncbi:MAG: nucleotidyltransferase domain-containing protein [Patescibacteria group bacterium]
MVFKGKAENKILDYFFVNVSARHYINELARILDLDPKNTYRKLLELEERGVLGSEFSGKQRYFFLAAKNRSLKNLRSLFLSTAGLERRLREIMKVDKKIKQAYLFGSYAQDKMSLSSDIDLLVVGHHSPLKLQKEIGRIQKEVGREINVINLSETEFKEKREKDAFLKNIFSKKIIRLK